MSKQTEMEERLAELEHTRWSGWQSYLHSLCIKKEDGSLIIPANRVDRWERQISTPYSKLSEDEKESDRIEARKTLQLFHQERQRCIEEIEAWRKGQLKEVAKEYWPQNKREMMYKLKRKLEAMKRENS